MANNQNRQGQGQGQGQQKQNNNFGVHLRATPIVESGKIELIAKVTKGFTPQSGLDVQFYRDGMLIPGATGVTAANGEATYMMDIPKGVKTMKVKADIAVSGVASQDTTVFVGAIANPSTGAPAVPSITIDDILIDRGVLRHSVALYNSKGVMVPGLLQISTSSPITIQFASRADEGNADLSKGLHRNSNYQEITVRGDRWEVYDIHFDQSLEMDVMVAGYRLSMPDLEFDINDPRLERLGAHGVAKPIPQHHVIAASVGFLFAWISALANLMGWYALIPAVVITAIFGIAASIDVAIYNGRLEESDENCRPNAGPLASLFMTNNRVCVCLWALTLYCAFMFFLMTPWGAPVLMEDTRDAMTAEQIAQERRPGDQAQRIRNIQRGLGPVTDRELEKPKAQPTWETWWIRLYMIIAMLFISVPYTFYAFSDETLRVIRWFRSGRRGRTEGTAGQERPGLIARLSNRVLGNNEPASAETADAPPATPPSAPAESTSNRNSILQTLGLTAMISIGSEIVEFIIENIGRKARKEQRKRYES